MVITIQCGLNMLNYLWAAMILIGIVYGVATGNVSGVSEGLIEGGGDAVSLAITMLGIISLWMGLMNIAMKSGLIDSIQRKMYPVIRWLFPTVPKEHPATQYITVNIIANLFGLGWAATPAGLEAMKELSDVSDKKAGHHVEWASDAMCTFLVINISSIQLIPVNIIAYRAQYGSVSPTSIIIPGLIATTISTAAGILFCKIAGRKKK